MSHLIWMKIFLTWTDPVQRQLDTKESKWKTSTFQSITVESATNYYKFQRLFNSVLSALFLDVLTAFTNNFPFRKKQWEMSVNSDKFAWSVNGSSIWTSQRKKSYRKFKKEKTNYKELKLKFKNGKTKSMSTSMNRIKLLKNCQKLRVKTKRNKKSKKAKLPGSKAKSKNSQKKMREARIGSMRNVKQINLKMSKSKLWKTKLLKLRLTFLISKKILKSRQRIWRQLKRPWISKETVKH